MENCQRKPNKPTRYAKVSLEERVKLVKLINEDGVSIGKAAKALSINLSTAKLIWSRFRVKGTFFQKKSDRKARMARLAAEKASVAKKLDHSVRSNSPQLSLSMGLPLPAANPQVFSRETPSACPGVNGGSYCHWWGYTCFMDPWQNWCPFY